MVSAHMPHLGNKYRDECLPVHSTDTGKTMAIRESQNTFTHFVPVKYAKIRALSFVSAQSADVYLEHLQVMSKLNCE